MKVHVRGHVSFKSGISPLKILNSDIVINLFSVGGIGVIMNIDRVAEMMATAGSSCKVRGISDSGWYLEKKPDLIKCKNNAKNCNTPSQAISKGMRYVHFLCNSKLEQKNFL